MGQNELERFSDFLQNNKEALTTVMNLGTDFKAIAAFAVQSGFDLVKDDFTKGLELGAEDLEKIAGGKKEFFASSEQVGGFLSF